MLEERLKVLSRFEPQKAESWTTAPGGLLRSDQEDVLLWLCEQLQEVTDQVHQEIVSLRVVLYIALSDNVIQQMEFIIIETRTSLPALAAFSRPLTASSTSIGSFT